MVKQRNEIDEKYQWDLSTIFATDQAWEEEAASSMLVTCWIQRKHFWIQPMLIWN